MIRGSGYGRQREWKEASFMNIHIYNAACGGLEEVFVLEIRKSREFDSF